MYNCLTHEHHLSLKLYVRAYANNLCYNNQIQNLSCGAAEITLCGHLCVCVYLLVYLSGNI